jgi:NO-binding membrane sensor protein with MHYT domain/two-component sensor histidine kinase
MMNIDNFFQLSSIPINNITGWYDLNLVILSYVVAVFSSYIALDITVHLRDMTISDFRRRLWLVGGAIAMGAGIWSMHFVGMLAFSLPMMPMSYDSFWTTLSLLIAILASGFALNLLKIQIIRPRRLAVGGILLGFAIASMHYAGMEGMKVHVDIHYLPGLFLLSILIAIIASEAALWLALKSAHKRQIKLKLFSAIVMGAAICGMHYTGMAAAVFTPKEVAYHHAMTINPTMLAVSIASLTIVIMMIAFFLSKNKEVLQKNYELAKSTEQLVKSNQELEQFAFIASHDLKAPLRSIGGLVSWIKKDEGNTFSEESRKNLSLIASRVERMSNLIDGILHYSQLGHVDLPISTVSVTNLIQEVVDTLSPPANITVHYAVNLPIFKTYKILLMQVITNLISNAIKYNDKKHGHIEIGVESKGDYYEFFVSDDGPGIEPEYHQKIFEIFQTLQPRDAVESTGIGLSIVKKIVEGRGGNVTVESDLGKGTIFRFTWPRIVKM